ncbi:unnamed protein product [Caenorhabditis sp. 36 PRJEB53466]|nr:unnamed protein product [Caenorhabditis sp. 36 PRJEB53466]
MPPRICEDFNYERFQPIHRVQVVLPPPRRIQRPHRPSETPTGRPFFSEVRARFVGNTSVYHELCALLGRRRRPITDTLIKKVIQLLYDHPDLVLDFSGTLPVEHHIYINRRGQYVHDNSETARVVPRAEIIRHLPDQTQLTGRALQNFTRALVFLRLAEERLSDDPNQFQRLLNFLRNHRRDRISNNEIFSTVVQTFYNHPDLVFHFRAFMFPWGELFRTNDGSYAFRNIFGAATGVVRGLARRERMRREYARAEPVAAAPREGGNP